MRKHKTIHHAATYITINFLAGTHRDDALKEAVLLALEEDTTVKFNFNGTYYTVSPDFVIHLTDKECRDS
jgi:hypothetical protein